MLEIRRHAGVRAVPADAWDALVGAGSPFLEWTWLAALEEAGCVGEGTGWIPAPVTAWRGERLVGAAPAYVKLHSMGEYVYDWSIAAWAGRRGVAWYPKLVVAVPFTPVTGQRLLVAPGEDAEEVRTGLLRGLARTADGMSGLHVLFPDVADAAAGLARGAVERLQAQYHWRDLGFGDFDGFLASLPAKRRAEIRRERRKVTGVRVEAREGLEPGLAGALWRFYDATYRRHTGAAGYLTPAFFEILAARWSHRLHTVLAWDGGDLVAGTLNVRKGDRLYGRWWGAARDVPYLHFEVAIYAAVEWCLRHGVTTFEPGHGGEHKRARGFAPTLVRSVHWVADRTLHAALADAFSREAVAVRAEVEGTGPAGGDDAEDAG